MSATTNARGWFDAGALTVEGMGTALPGPPIGTSELLRHIDAHFGLTLSRRGAAVARRLGVGTRHISRDLRARTEQPRAIDANAALAARAVTAALCEAKRGVDEVRYLIAHTATPATWLPPGVTAVAEHLGYTGPCVELRQACTGFANALVFARGLADGLVDGVAVIVGSETGSTFFDPLRAAACDAQLINMLQMGDGAAAVVLSGRRMEGSCLQRLYYGHSGRGRAPGFMLAAGAREFAHDYASVRQYGAELFRSALAAAQALGISLSEVDWLIPHQANGHMARLLGDDLGFDPDRIHVNADRVGNTGSAAIWLALAELRPRMRPGERALVLGAEATHYMYGGFEYVHA